MLLFMALPCGLPLLQRTGLQLAWVCAADGSHSCEDLVSSWLPRHLSARTVSRDLLCSKGPGAAACPITLHVTSTPAGPPWGRSCSWKMGKHEPAHSAAPAVSYQDVTCPVLQPVPSSAFLR